MVFRSSKIASLEGSGYLGWVFFGLSLEQWSVHFAYLLCIGDYTTQSYLGIQKGLITAHFTKLDFPWFEIGREGFSHLQIHIQFRDSDVWDQKIVSSKNCGRNGGVIDRCMVSTTSCFQDSVPGFPEVKVFWRDVLARMTVWSIDHPKMVKKWWWSLMFKHMLWRKPLQNNRIMFGNLLALRIIGPSKLAILRT